MKILWISWLDEIDIVCVKSICKWTSKNSRNTYNKCSLYPCQYGPFVLTSEFSMIGNYLVCYGQQKEGLNFFWIKFRKSLSILLRAVTQKEQKYCNASHNKNSQKVVQNVMDWTVIVAGNAPESPRISFRNNLVADLQMSWRGLLFWKTSLFHAKYLDLAPLSDLDNNTAFLSPAQKSRCRSPKRQFELFALSGWY